MSTQNNNNDDYNQDDDLDFIPLTIQTCDVIFNNTSFYECVDIDILNLCLFSDETSEHDKQILTNIRKKLINKCKLPTNYKKSEGKDGFGRVFAVKRISLMCLSRRTREIMTCRNWVDLDLVNGHPSILLCICEGNGIVCNHLTEYVSNRDDIIDELKEYYAVSPKEIKLLFLRGSFLGSHKKWAEENNASDLMIDPFVGNFFKQMKLIARNISNANPNVKEMLIRNNNEYKMWWHDEEFIVPNNIDAKVMAYVCQEWECQIISIAISYLMRQRKIIKNKMVIYSYNGMMLYKEHIQDMNIEITQLCLDLNREVKAKSNFEIRFSEKIISSEGLEELLTQSEAENNFTEHDLKCFDIQKFRTLKTYKAKKKYCEHFFCKLIDPPTYVFRGNNTNKPKLRSMGELKHVFGVIGSSKANDKGQETSFVQEWLYDIDIKTKNSMEYYPKMKDENEPNNIYNLFYGYNEAINVEYNTEIREQIILPFKSILLELCEHDYTYETYMMNLFAKTYKHPRDKAPICHVLISPEGCGKNSCLDAVANVIGRENYFCSSKVSDVFGEHAMGSVGKLIVVLNELNPKDAENCMGQIKSAITEIDLTVNPKCKEHFQTENYATYFVLSNENYPIIPNLLQGNRRFFFLKATDAYKYITAQQWTNIHVHFKSPQFLCALRDTFILTECENFDWEGEKPNSKHYLHIAQSFLPSPILFFIRFIEDNKPWIENNVVNISATSFYNKYINFCSTQGFSKKYAKPRFGIELNRIKTFNIIRTSSGSEYNFDLLETYKYMIQRDYVTPLNDENVWNNLLNSIAEDNNNNNNGFQPPIIVSMDEMKQIPDNNDNDNDNDDEKAMELITNNNDNVLNSQIQFDDNVTVHSNDSDDNTVVKNICFDQYIDNSSSFTPMLSNNNNNRGSIFTANSVVQTTNKKKSCKRKLKLKLTWDNNPRLRPRRY